MINYYLITKPGIIMGNLITLMAGFFLASQGEYSLLIFFYTLIGLAFVMASACVFNNYIDRERDRTMKRTQGRALVTGVISPKKALRFATLLGMIGTLFLFFFTNLLTVAVALSGFFVYVVLYSIWKGRTQYGTAIGSIAGSVPPLVGYCAVTNQIDVGALLLFALLTFWQMPHFFSIAVYRLDDYAAASIPVLPLLKGMHSTKVRMLLYIALFIGTSALLTYYEYTNRFFLCAALLLGAFWFVLGLRGLQCKSDAMWARQMFRISLVVITGLSLLIPFTV